MSHIIDETAATRQHLEMLIRKRNTMNQAIADSFEQLFAAIERGEWSEGDCVEWYAWVKSQGVPNTINRMLKTLKVSLFDIKIWRDGPPFQRFDNTGIFPIYNQRMPKKGTPVVYLIKTRSLIKDLVFVSYVGQSINVRSRLRQHWQSEKRDWMHSWEIIVCDSVQHMKQLEADLIFQHKPHLNIQGTQTRGYFAEQTADLFTHVRDW